MNIEFNIVFKEQLNSQSVVVFEINQISSLVRKTSVGQFVKSRPFDLNYPMTIGKTKWVVILFLNGQYENGGIPNDLICAYLKMVQCEHQSVVFNFDVRFQLGSQHTTVSKKDQRIRFDNARTRWIRTKLTHINEITVNRSQLIQGDTLMLSVYVNEHCTTRSLTETFPTSSTYNNKNNYSFKEIFSVKEKSEMKPVTTSTISNRQNRYNINQSNIEGDYNIYRTNVPQSSYNAAASSINTSVLFVNNRKRIGDRNLVYDNNEYSNDKNVAQNTNSSTISTGWVSNVFSGFEKMFKK